jgi:hypothetical protein
MLFDGWMRGFRQFARNATSLRNIGLKRQDFDFHSQFFSNPMLMARNYPVVKEAVAIGHVTS